MICELGKMPDKCSNDKHTYLMVHKINWHTMTMSIKIRQSGRNDKKLNNTQQVKPKGKNQYKSIKPNK